MKLHLHNGPFNSIKNGSKTIEMRLYDEKRRKLKVGDIIEFINRSTDEKLEVKIINLYLFENFNELYQKFDKIVLGYKEDEVANPDDMNKYYPKEEQEQFGVVAIEIKKCK